ncbi:RNA polymerase sigma factor [Runella sp.]|uniref:RNA polymerase sigma factor n=1 Tax=Runella sp. TaxID=1960881 RepID=UPI003D126595
MAKRITFSSQSELFEALTSNDQRQQNRGFDYIYDEIYGSFRQWVYTVNKGSEDDAKDAFQTGLLSFVLDLRAGKSQLRDTIKITTEIFRNCKGDYLNFINSADYQKKTSLPTNLEVVDTINNQQKNIEENETKETLQQALDKLDGKCRTVLHMFYIEGLSLQEIAEKLTMTVNAVKQKRYECTQKLKDIFAGISKKL